MSGGRRPGVTQEHQVIPPALTAEHLAWETDAACRDHDPDLFFPEWSGHNGTAQKYRAIAICNTCPLHAVVGCARKALSLQSNYGIWAGQHLGTTATTRRNARHQLQLLAETLEAN